MADEIVGNLLDHPIMAHQVNCLTVRAHGLSRAIATAFSWADVYSERRPVGRRNLAVPEDRAEPGTIVVRSRDGRTVVAIAGQWDYGVPSPPRHGRPANHADSRAARANWFDRGLEQLGRLGLESVAFPHGVGCGLAGGDWTVYRAAIERFAVEHPETRVSIVALP